MILMVGYGRRRSILQKWDREKSLFLGGLQTFHVSISFTTGQPGFSSKPTRMSNNKEPLYFRVPLLRRRQGERMKENQGTCSRGIRARVFEHTKEQVKYKERKSKKKKKKEISIN